MIGEKVADALTGGKLTEAKQEAMSAKESLSKVTGQYRELSNETHRLAREIQEIKESGEVLAEGYADSSWNSRLTLDKQWQLLSGYSQHRVIRKEDVDLYHDLVSFGYQFSPLLKGAIDMKTRYTFGLSFSIESEIDKNKKIIEAVQKDPKNKIAFFGAQAIEEADRELQKSGNIYIAVWTKLNPPQVRLFSSYEISDVITDPEDADIPLFYIRSWTSVDGTAHKMAYPSVLNDEKYTSVVDGLKLETEVDNNIRVWQMCEGRGLKQKWALSPYTSALPWNRAYEGFLLDFAAIVKIIRKYSTMFTTKGGDSQVSALSTQFAHEQNSYHANQVGNALISAEGNDYKVVDAGSGKIVGPADSQYFLRQFCTSTGVPENLLTGNPQTGNRASAQELTANFLPLIEDRQTAWTETFEAIFTVILENPEFSVSFPPLRSQDALTYIQTLIQTATLGTGRLSGVIRPEDLIRAVYESLDLKMPDDADIDAMVQAILDQINSDPAGNMALQNLTQATNDLSKFYRMTDQKTP